ncbi:MAG: hypothetical protein CL916_02725 [Deltaproteobacteria bacterium]|nr:hypothetical protein [Deltaproteobacteria bacterium]
MEEKKLIIRIAKIKQSLRISMVQHLPIEVVEKIEHTAIERRVERWFTDLHRREVNRRTILKGLILPGNRSTTRPVPNINDLVESKGKNIIDHDRSDAVLEKSSKNNDETNQLIQDLLYKDDNTPNETSSQNEATKTATELSADIPPEPNQDEDVEEAIPLLVPQGPKRRATQKKILRPRTSQRNDVPKEEPAIEKEEDIVHSNDISEESQVDTAINEPEHLQVLTPSGIETFAVIQDPELKLSPTIPSPEEEQKICTLEELCDALDENPTSIDTRMKRAAHYEKENKLVLALSDYRKAAEQNHVPGWDAYIRLLLQCNLKARAAEAEARRERI